MGDSRPAARPILHASAGGRFAAAWDSLPTPRDGAPDAEEMAGAGGALGREDRRRPGAADRPARAALALDPAADQRLHAARTLHGGAPDPPALDADEADLPAARDRGRGRGGSALPGARGLRLRRDH